MNLIKDLERKEIEFMRLRRNKICVDDFELLAIIGRGAFGEVGGILKYLSSSISVYTVFNIFRALNIFLFQYSNKYTFIKTFS